MDEFISTKAVAPRKQSCRVRMLLPALDADAIFTCNNTKGHNGDHNERGRVRSKDGKVVTYDVAWRDAPSEVWRGPSNGV